MAERLGILISGGGTTMAEIIKATQTGEVPMEVGCVISSRAEVKGLVRALDLGIAHKDVIPIIPKFFKKDDGSRDDEAFGETILKVLREREVTLITQNGWLPLTPENVIAEYDGRIYNQHPGPLPEFGGKGMYGRRVLEARLVFYSMTNRDPWTRVVAHRVTKEFDEGAIVKSAEVVIYPGDSADSLQQRALPIEHATQIALLKDVASNQVREEEPVFLVKPEEEWILKSAKEIAIKRYPHG